MRHLAVLFLGTLAIIAVSFTYSSALAVTVEVSIENLSPQHGQGIAPVSFAFHDGSFDLFDEGQPASIAVELMAEDGLNGDPNGRVPLGFFLAAFAAGADPTKAPAMEETIAGQFALSPAGLVGGVQDLLFFDRRENPYFGVQLPGETLSVKVELDDKGKNQQFFSFAGMLFPTNDAFIANDHGTAIRVFDDQGMFLGADFVIFGSQVWDAGTEVNDEDPVNVPYSLENGLNSVEENGAIHLHEGLLPPGSGGIVDFEFAGELIAVNADFSAPGYEIARITIRQSGDCNGDSALNAADLSCVSSIEARDAVLKALNILPGDLDGNGDVAFADFLVLSTNFGQDLPSYADGNIDLKGGVTFEDFLVLSTNFGKTPHGVAGVPEPQSFVVGLSFFSLMAFRRHRRRKRGQRSEVVIL